MPGFNPASIGAPSPIGRGGGGSIDTIGSTGYFGTDPGSKYAKSDGRFVSGLPDGFPYLLSPDAPLSATGGTSTASPVNRVAYGNGRYLSAGDGNNVCISDDGASYVSAASRDSDDWKDVAFGKGLFVIVGSGQSGFINTTINGAAFNRRLSGQGSWYAVTFNGSRFVAVGTNFAWSDDGINWNIAGRDTGTDTTYTVVYFNKTWFAYGFNGVCYTSTDGTYWTNRNRTPAYNIRKARAGNGRIYASGNSDTFWLVSSDGLNFRAIPYPSPYTGEGVNFAAPIGPYIMVGGARGYASIYQDDLLIRNITLTGNSGAVNDCFYGLNSYIVPSSNNGFIYSFAFGPTGIRLPALPSLFKPNGDRLDPYMRIAA